MRLLAEVRSALAGTVLLSLLTGTALLASDATSTAPVTAPSNSADEIVDNLVRMNRQRARALLRTESSRIYHLSYQGFMGGRDADMTVQAIYTSPSSKEFNIVSQSGSKIMIDRVLRKLLESEIEAAQPAISAGTELSRDNYTFQLVAYEPSAEGGEYVLSVTPRVRSKYAYRGKVWIDKRDFAVTKVQAEPARNPSFWTKKTEIRYEYKKVQGFWLPSRSESVSEIRLGGHATLTVDYTNYRVNETAPLHQVHLN